MGSDPAGLAHLRGLVEDLVRSHEPVASRYTVWVVDGDVPSGSAKFGSLGLVVSNQSSLGWGDMLYSHEMEESIIVRTAEFLWPSKAMCIS